MTSFAGSTRAAVLAVPALAAAVLGGTGLTPRPAAAARVAVTGSRPYWATPARALPGAPAGRARLRVYLTGRDPAGLARYALAVSTPGDPDYGRFLSPAGAERRFGPGAAQVRAVRSWLAAAGLRITAVRAARAAGAYIAAAGPLAAAGRAFGVTFRSYRGPGGRAYRAPAAAPTVPARLARSVLGVSGLDTAPHLVQPAGRPVRNQARPCATYFGQKIAYGRPAAGGRHQPWAVCGYRPSQIRGAYGVTASGMTGAGQSVAIVDAYRSPTLLADADRYAAVTGDPPLRPGQFRQYQAGPPRRGPGCPVAHWYGEQTLDVEALHGMAPGATISYVAAASCGNDDLLDALALVVNRRLARIVSDSWGGPADGFDGYAVYDTVFELGAVEGIGFSFSTGDHGYNAPAEYPVPGQSDRIQVSFPPSSPWVTAVGGTSLAIGRHQRYLFETSWGSVLDAIRPDGRGWRYPPPGRYPQDYNGSGGGGVSTVFRQPGYQRRVVPRRLATALPDGSASKTPMRVVPDVSAVADPSTGMVVGETVPGPRGSGTRYSLSEVGGTSLACPVFAGIEADAQQAAGHPFGFANPVIYARYGTGAFHDVTDRPLGPHQLYAVFDVSLPGTGRRTVTLLTTLGRNGTGPAALRAVRGYDDATGVGSPARYVESFAP